MHETTASEIVQQQQLKDNSSDTAPARSRVLRVCLVASEFHMAYLPSSLLSGSCAAVQLSNSSKTDRLPQPVLQIAAAVPSR